MSDRPTSQIGLNGAAQITLRMLIASYFMAAALGSIPGASYDLVFVAVLPAPMGAILAGSLVFMLASLVLIGAHTRLAALLLGLMTFYGSYLQMMQTGMVDILGIFWRDMAMIAALMLTYSRPAEKADPIVLRPLPRRLARRADRARHTSAPLSPLPGVDGTPDAPPPRTRAH